MGAYSCFKSSVCYLQYILLFILTLMSPTISDVGLVEWEKVSGKGINDHNLLILTVSNVLECKRLCLENQPQCRSIEFHTGDLRCLLQDVAFGDAGIYTWYSSAYFEYYSLCELGKCGIPNAWWRHQMETFSALLTFVRGIHRSPVNSPHESQWRGALMFYLVCDWAIGWVNNEYFGSAMM